jgi:hypothetical protein
VRRYRIAVLSIIGNVRSRVSMYDMGWLGHLMALGVCYEC